VTGVEMTDVDVDETKEKVKELYSTREEMEKEMAEIAQRLTEEGMPGLRGALVDREGFPMPGVDLYQVRGDRGRYATLRNDHADVTKELEKRLSELHMQAGVTKGVANMELTREAVEQLKRDEDDAFMRARARAAAQYGAPPGALAFAYVDEVTAGSPASSAGLRVGDVILMFGDVTGPHDAGTLPRVAATLAQREGHPVAVWVSRGGSDVRLDVTPKKWEGRGLLGCHMRPR
jgi:26S proteasome non-ATPase regulatory subunit 9